MNITTIYSEPEYPFYEQHPIVYTDSLTLKNGKIVYFALEKVENEHDVNKWKKYVDLTKQLIGQRGILHAMLIYLRQGKPENQIKTEVMNYTKWPEDKVIDIINELRNRYMGKNLDNEFKESPFQTTAGIEFVLRCLNQYKNEKNEYLMYISKIPVTGKFLIPENITLQNCINVFKDIIMTVSFSTSENSNTITHMGIQRQPLSNLEDGYNNLSMKLHAFGALVGYHYMRKQYLVTDPTLAMEKIMKNSLPEHAFINSDELTNHCIAGTFGASGNVAIRLDELSKLFVA